jgi:predicted nucleic acid-binding protein
LVRAKTVHTHSQPALIIAATAQLHGMTLVSRDRTEYERARVPVLSPWAEA